ncbi:MAG: hypothetical protein IPJ06_09405 [Saprospiraceae bacterium]|nr:hypothetical protein [Saprospiraceae bacterium]
MKNFSLLFLFMLGVLAVGSAQDEEAARAYKKAKRALGAYNLDQNANADKLDEAIDMIKIATHRMPPAADADTGLHPVGSC